MRHVSADNLFIFINIQKTHYFQLWQTEETNVNEKPMQANTVLGGTRKWIVQKRSSGLANEIDGQGIFLSIVFFLLITNRKKHISCKYNMQGRLRDI